MRFAEWKDARSYAEKTANDTCNDMAIRVVKEFGVKGFNVSFASKNDSDYARAEIVIPIWRDMLQQYKTPPQRHIIR